MKKYLAASYDRSAKSYDDSFRTIQYKKYRSLILPYLNAIENRILLDVGCGTGLLSDFLTEENIGCRYIGIDLSFNMLRCADNKKTGVYAQGDMYLLPVKSSSAGIVTSFTVVNIFPDDLDAVISEFRRVLKPGGLVIMSILQGNFDDIIYSLFDKYGFLLKTSAEAGQDAGFLYVKNN